MSPQCEANADFLLEPAHIEAWEAKHGRIGAGSWVLMRTGWSKREDPATFLNASETGPHVPGPSVACMQASAFFSSARSVEGSARNTTLPLVRTVFTSSKPAFSKQRRRSSFFAIVGSTPRRNAA